MANTLKLFREQIALSSAKEEIQGSIVLPENRFIKFGLGQVVATGDGVYPALSGEEKSHEVPMRLKEGDLVMYQLGGPQEVNAKFKHDGKDIKIMHQGDCLAKLTSTKVSLETFKVLGDYLLLEPKALQHGLIVVPKAAVQADDWHFFLVQVGDNVKLPIQVGQEVYPERGKCAPIEIDGKTFVFTHQSFIHGINTEMPKPESLIEKPA